MSPVDSKPLPSVTASDPALSPLPSRAPARVKAQPGPAAPRCAGQPPLAFIYPGANRQKANARAVTSHSRRGPQSVPSAGKLRHAPGARQPAVTRGSPQPTLGARTVAAGAGSAMRSPSGFADAEKPRSVWGVPGGWRLWGMHSDTSPRARPALTLFPVHPLWPHLDMEFGGEGSPRKAAAPAPAAFPLLSAGHFPPGAFCAISALSGPR